MKRSSLHRRLDPVARGLRPDRPGRGRGPARSTRPRSGGTSATSSTCRRRTRPRRSAATRSSTRLHGLFEGSGFWERRGLATLLAGWREKGALPEFLVVAVDGGNSFFVNGKAGRYEDMVTRDLIAHVESSYRVVPGRAGRGLLGISMGGYAALHIAFDQPALFAAVATHSAMLLEQAALGRARGRTLAHGGLPRRVRGSDRLPALGRERPSGCGPQGGREGRARPLLRLRDGGSLRAGERAERPAPDPARNAGSLTPSSWRRGITATSSSGHGSRRAWASWLAP